MKRKIVVSEPVPKQTQITGVNAFCEDQMPVISVTLNGTYLWSTGQSSPSLTLPPVSQEYSVMVTDASGCTYTASKSVTVNPLPVVSTSFIPTGEITGQLTASGAGLYEWYPPFGLSCSVCQSPKVNLDGDSRFCVKGTDMHGCSNMACTDASVSTVYIPNTFTPNKDGLNDLFMPIVREVCNYKLAVYNRWGEEIFRSNDATEAWDGLYKNEESPEGIYLYKLELNNKLNGKPYKYTGTVNLIR
jgi:gliding motility-associated-like protein